MNRESNIAETAGKVSDFSKGQIFLRDGRKEEINIYTIQPCTRHLYVFSNLIPIMVLQGRYIIPFLLQVRKTRLREAKFYA